MRLQQAQIILIHWQIDQVLSVIKAWTVVQILHEVIAVGTLHVTCKNVTEGLQ